MKQIRIIFKKEFLDTLRDKRTLLTMLVIPLLIFPVIMTVFSTISKSYAEEEANKEIKIGYVDNGEGSAVLEEMKKADKFTFEVFKDSLSIAKAVRSEKINAGIIFNDGFNDSLQSEISAPLTLIFRGTEQEELDRVEDLLERQDSIIVANRLSALGKEKAFIHPTRTSYADTSSIKEIIGKYAGGILPYFFIIFCFIGCMYPAIDLFTGEKERKTIETILTVPVSRLQILIGKMSVVVLSGLLASTLALVGLFVSAQFLDIIDENLLEIINDILSFKFILLLYTMLIPLTIFFAGIMIPIAVYAKTFKEAQSIITPLNVVAILPAMVGFFPGVELTLTTAFIPVVNVVLCTKEVVGGTIDYGLLAIVVVSLIAMASIAVALSVKQFGKESNILR
jgi:sodium transport system permease protein